MSRLDLPALPGLLIAVVIALTAPVPADTQETKHERAQPVTWGPGTVANPSDLVVRVTERGKPARNVEVIAGTSAGAKHRRVTDDEGMVRWRNLADGTWHVTAHVDDWSRAGWGGTVLPRLIPGPVELTLAPTRTVEVLVLKAETGAPIAGARFRVQRAWFEAGPMFSPTPAPTDPGGRTRLVGVPPNVALRLADFTTPEQPQRVWYEWCPRVPPGKRQIRIERKSPRLLRFPVVALEGVPLADGTVVRLRPPPWKRDVDVDPDPPTTGTIRNGVLHVPGVIGTLFRATAEAPDGRQALLWEYSGCGQKACLVHSRTVEVQALDTDGQPAAGVGVALSGAGGAYISGQVTPVLKTDARGLARFRGPFVDWIEPWIVANPDGPSIFGTDMKGWWRHQRSLGPPQGKVSPTSSNWLTRRIPVDAGVPRITGVVQPVRDVVVRVTVDGVCCLPAKYHLERPYALRETVDAGGGEIRFSFRPWYRGQTPFVRMRAPGLLTAVARRALKDPGSPLVMNLDLQSGGWLFVRMLHPSNRWRGLRLEKLEADGWEKIHGDVEPGIDCVARLAPLAAGTYRIVHEHRKLTSRALHVQPGKPAFVTVDLRAPYRK